MLFSDFAQTLQSLEEVSSRLEMTEILADLFTKLDQDEIIPASYLLQGRLVPQYQSLEFNVSTKLLQRVLAKVAANGAASNETTNLFGESDSSQFEQHVQQRYLQTGDLGEVAAELLNGQKKSSSMSILDVFENLTEIAQEEGSGSQDRKITSVTDLLMQLDAISAKYVTRMVMGKLRLGFSTMTMIDALSWAVAGDKSERAALEEAFNKQADIGQIAKQYLTWQKKSAEARLKALDDMTVELGIPVMPALCQRLNTSQEIIDKLGTVIVEPKYDGIRVQIHVDKKAEPPVHVYTRSLDEITHMFPELTATALAALDATTCILDGEVIGFNPKTGQLVPFQETITRRRKHNVAVAADQTPVRFYLFDLLYRDGQSLISKKLRERKELLNKLIKDNEVFLETPYKITDDPVEVHEYHEKLLSQKLEGAVIKRVDAPYTSGRKGWAWVKIKESEGTTGKLSDTLDLVVMGYYSGRGKRAQFGLGALLLGTLDEQASGDQPAIKTIAKLGSGMTEDQLVALKKVCDQHAVPEKPSQYDVPKELKPEVWCQPALVVEVAADELTNSPLHTAKVALRFPRLVQRRDDKNWEQITTLQELDQFK